MKAGYTIVYRLTQTEVDDGAATPLAGGFVEIVDGDGLPTGVIYQTGAADVAPVVMVTPTYVAAAVIAGRAPNWPALTAVVSGALYFATATVGGIVTGDLIRANSSRTTRETFDATEAGNWTATFVEIGEVAGAAAAALVAAEAYAVPKAGGTMAGDLKLPRLKASEGTALVAADFALSNGWGIDEKATAAVNTNITFSAAANKGSAPNGVTKISFTDAGSGSGVADAVAVTVAGQNISVELRNSAGDGLRTLAQVAALSYAVTSTTAAGVVTAVVVGGHEADAGSVEGPDDFITGADKATVSAVTGTDQAWQATVTAGSGTVGASPTLTLTYKNGTWATAPIGQSKLMASNDDATVHLSDVVGATTFAITFGSTPVASKTYRIAGLVIGV